MSFFELNLYVDSRDVDGQNHCRPSAVLGLLQEAATQAAVELNVSREELLDQYNLFWMLARLWYRLERPLHWNETVRIKTWHRGSKGATMYRDFDLFVGGEYVGEAVSAWVLADQTTRRLARLSEIKGFEGTDGGALCKEKTLAKLKAPALTPMGKREIHYSDTDINGHVNNTRYADFACDALYLHQRPAGCFVREMQIGYLAECKPGELLTLSVGSDENGSYVFGSGDDKPRFETRILCN